MTGQTRRQFLAAAGAAAAFGLDPLAADARRRHRHRRRRRVHHRPRHHAQPGLEQIEHVVIAMQENRSFDSYFGTLRGVRGFSDPHPLTLPDGKPVFYQPSTLLGGCVLPWRLDIATQNPCELLVSNDWPRMHSTLDGGRLDRWSVSRRRVPDVFLHARRHPLADGARRRVHWSATATTPRCSGRRTRNCLYSMTGTIDPAAIRN